MKKVMEFTGALMLAALCGCADSAPPPAAKDIAKPAVRKVVDASHAETAAVSAVLTAIAEELNEPVIVAVDSHAGFMLEAMEDLREFATSRRPVRGDGLSDEHFDLLLENITTPVRYEHVELPVKTSWVNADVLAEWNDEAEGNDNERFLPPRFHNEHPKARGVMTPSAVSLSDDQATAVMHISRCPVHFQWCGNCQTGEDVPWVAVVQREGDVWTVTDLVPLLFY